MRPTTLAGLKFKHKHLLKEVLAYLKTCISLTALLNGRSAMGLPSDWSVVEEWLNSENCILYPANKEESFFEKKNAEIPTLERYDIAPNEDFWKFFPKRGLPNRPTSKVNARNLKILLDKCRSKMSKTEIRRAERVILDLKTGASAYQKKDLPPITVPNSGSCYKYGELLTDKIATWIKDGFVAGPFDTPPLPGFRANPLIAVARNGKIRPVINMSGPVGASFNDNLERSKLEKVHMTTAKQFGFSLKESGVRAVFSKFDIKDAYKLIPVKLGDIRLQGFYWLGKWFCETQETFGGVPSVCNFDRLGNTTTTLVVVLSEIEAAAVSRTLDDFQGVGPEGSGIAEKFTKVMKEVCGFLNIPLADTCPKNEKAFELATRGTVLGVGFDSSNLTWFISEEKSNKIVRRCLDILNSSHASLRQVQELMGSINDLSQMNGFLKYFRGSGNSFVGKFKNNENLLLMIPEEVKEEVLVAAKIAVSAKSGIPLASRKYACPLSALEFTSDAAGAKYNLHKGLLTMVKEPNRGVCSLGGESTENIWFKSKLVWPEGFLCLKDEKGTEFGRKSTTLEALGVLLPFVVKPKFLAGKHIIFWVDNAAVCYGWENGYIKFDKEAYGLLRCIHILASFLGSIVYVKHVPRMSTELARLADELSRKEKPSCSVTQNLLCKVSSNVESVALLSWLKKPYAMSSLARNLLEEVKTMMSL